MAVLLSHRSSAVRVKASRWGQDAYQDVRSSMALMARNSAIHWPVAVITSGGVAAGDHGEQLGVALVPRHGHHFHAQVVPQGHEAVYLAGQGLVLHLAHRAEDRDGPAVVPASAAQDGRARGGGSAEPQHIAAGEVTDSPEGSGVMRHRVCFSTANRPLARASALSALSFGVGS